MVTEEAKQARQDWMKESRELFKLLNVNPSKSKEHPAKLVYDTMKRKGFNADYVHVSAALGFGVECWETRVKALRSLREFYNAARPAVLH